MNSSDSLAMRYCLPITAIYALSLGLFQIPNNIFFYPCFLHLQYSNLILYLRGLDPVPLRLT